MRRVEFGSLFHFIRNGLSVKQDKAGDGLPISRIETISRGFVDPRRVGFAGLQEEDCAEWLLLEGDILFSHINSVEHIGKCAVYEGAPKNLVHGMNLLCLRSNPTHLLPSYGKHLIRSGYFRQKLLKYVNKSVNQASVSVGNLKTIQVEVPDIEQQRCIAAILDKADAIRRKRQQALALADDFLRSAFLEMFGDPVTNPKGWELVPLGKLGRLERGRSVHRPRNAPELLGGQYPLIQTGDVASALGGRISKFRQTYSELGLNQSRMWPKGTLCITIAANIADAAFLDFDACFPDSVVGFTSDEQTKAYVYGLLIFLKPLIDKKAPQVAQKNITLEMLRGLPAPSPDREAKEHFAKFMLAHQKLLKQLWADEGGGLFASLSQRAFRGDLSPASVPA